LEKKSPEAYRVMREFYEISHWPAGWTHGVPHYSRILREGLDSYEERIARRPEGEEFREGLLRLMQGLRIYIARIRDYLKSISAEKALLDALEQVPFRPARTYYEGLVCWNLVFYLDGCDNLGRIDEGLYPLYRGEDMTHVIAQMYDNLDAMDRWSCTLGPNYNPVTEQALLAIRGKRRPLVEVRVTDQMPDRLWEIAAENLRGGCTNPSFYNDEAIKNLIRSQFPQMPEEDLVRFCGAGCTETNLDGITRAGGTDEIVNLAKIFEDHLYENLETAEDFESFFQGLCEKTRSCVNAHLDKVTQWYLYEKEYLPNPIRTLLFDDCIDKGKDFNAGGARYTWTMSGHAGLINVIDSLAAIRKLVYEDRRYTPGEFLRLLKAEDPGFYRQLANCPCYGVQDDAVDALAARYAQEAYRVYRERPGVDFIDAFTLTEHQFTRHISAGAQVGPTPDGRKGGEPTCDSIAALRGKAVLGPTAMLSSAARLPQHMPMGISVLNLSLEKRYCENPDLLRALVEGYFRLGGVQMQLTVTSAEELQDALVHPERHQDLIVRVGGYSEYFTRLTPELRAAVCARMVHK